MGSIRSIGIVFIFSLALLIGCKEDNEPVIELDIITDLQVIKNPFDVAPLTAEIRVTTNRNASVSLKVIGKNGSESDIIHDFPYFGNEFKIPVLGLYPDFFNQVELTFFDEDNRILDSEIVSIQTDALISDMPQIEINTQNSISPIPGLYFVNYFGFDEEAFPQRPFMFDKFGDIRWYLDYSQHPTLFNLFSDYGMERLQNGNLIFGDGHADPGILYEISMLGEILNTWNLQEYGYHHTVIEKTNGNFIVTVNDFTKPTIEDVILEIDRNNGAIVNKWDLNESLDNSRDVLSSNLVDWFHANGVVYSESDDAIIVSGRTQGVVKLTPDNEVVWIIAPHKGWETSGNGTDLNQFLLQPLDAQGVSIENVQIIEGDENHSDFEWAWYQHSPILLPNGNVMVFDNGENRNFSGNELYSRGVEYQIDEENRTIRQVWSYGKGRGEQTHSRIVSKVRYHEDESNIIFAPGAVKYEGTFYGKVIEVDKQSEQVLFEATITPPNPFSIITFHNVQRMMLYRE